MNDLKLEKKWSKVKNKLMQEYRILSDQDLRLEIGKEDELLARLQEKLGKTKEEIKSYIKSI